MVKTSTSPYFWKQDPLQAPVYRLLRNQHFKNDQTIFRKTTKYFFAQNSKTFYWKKSF